MCFDQNPTDSSLAQAVQTEISWVWSFLRKQRFWQNVFLIFPVIQVSVENVYHPFLFQKHLAIKVIHTCYLIEGNGCTSPRHRTHRLSLIAIVSYVLLVIK